MDPRGSGGDCKESVSVVIVAHNNWPELEMAIHSALQQSFPPLEVIVVDNGSSDGTQNYVAVRFRERVRYVRQNNRLDGGGYNTGIKLAVGEFIQLLDGDDCLAPNKIEKELELFRADPMADIVYSDARQFQGPPGRAQWTESSLGDFPDILTALCDHGGRIGLTIACLFRRKVFETVGLFDETIFGADYDFWFRAASCGCRFRYTPGTLLFYRQWAGQMTRNTRMNSRAEQTFAKALTYVTEERHRQSLRRHLARVRLWQALDIRLGPAGALKKLREARQTSAEGVSWLVYVSGVILITIPFGRRFLANGQIRAIGRLAEMGSGRRSRRQF